MTIYCHYPGCDTVVTYIPSRPTFSDNPVEPSKFPFPPLLWIHSRLLFYPRAFFFFIHGRCKRLQWCTCASTAPPLVSCIHCFFKKLFLLSKVYIIFSSLPLSQTRVYSRARQDSDLNCVLSIQLWQRPKPPISFHFDDSIVYYLPTGEGGGVNEQGKKKDGTKR